MADQPDSPADEPAPPPPPQPLKPRPRPAALTQNLSGVAKLSQTQAVPPRRNLPASQPAAKTTTHLSELVSLAMQVQALADEQSGKSSTSPEPPSRKAKKFTRTGTPDGRALTQPLSQFAPAPAAGPAAGAPPPPKNLATVAAPLVSPPRPTGAWPRLVKADAPPAPAPVRRAKARLPQNNFWVWAAVQGFCFGLIALGYALGGGFGTPASKPTEAVRPMPEQSGERGFAAANAALQAEKNGDSSQARQLYETALNQKLALPGASYRLALLALRRGDLAAAEPALQRVSQAGENVAACAYLRARLAFGRGDSAESLRQLQAAAHAEPFDGKYLFYWGEALRRQGSNEQAAGCFAQAADRPGRAADLAFYTFKRRLLRATGGTGGDPAVPLADDFRPPASEGERLLLAAAQSIARFSLKEVSDSLKKAAAALPPGRFESLTRDYCFKSFVRPAPTPARLSPEEEPDPLIGSINLDPASASPEEADPALWPLPVSGTAP